MQGTTSNRPCSPLSWPSATGSGALCRAPRRWLGRAIRRRAVRGRRLAACWAPRSLSRRVRPRSRSCPCPTRRVLGRCATPVSGRSRSVRAWRPRSPRDPQTAGPGQPRRGRRACARLRGSARSPRLPHASIVLARVPQAGTGRLFERGGYCAPTMAGAYDGTLYARGQDGYEDARRAAVWNARRPSAIPRRSCSPRGSRMF